MNLTMKYGFMLCLIVSPLLLIGQRHIVGRAIDSETKLPIKNVAISSGDDKRKVFTNNLGFFELTIDETIKKLNLDHVSYGLLEFTIPEQNKFTLALNAIDLEMPLVDLRSFGEYSKHKITDDSTIVQKEINRPVYFNGGFAGLYNYLGDHIKIKDSVADNFICLFPDTVFSADVRFTVTKLGKVANAKITGDTLYGMGNLILDVITNAKWKPALQQGQTCDQNVKVKIYFGDYAFVVVDNPASFPIPNSNCVQKTTKNGDFTNTSFCIDGFYKYINNNLVYPTEAKKKKISGSVFVKFVVNKNGKIVKDKIKIIKGLGYGLDEEAIRLLSNCPAWKPASQRGINVYQTYTLPIKFER